MKCPYVIAAPMWEDKDRNLCSKKVKGACLNMTSYKECKIYKEKEKK